MSGIYGVWTPGTKGPDTTEKKGLRSWNLAYGSNDESLVIGDAYLGCSRESCSDTLPQSRPVLVREGKYAVADALLYNREELMKEGGFTEELSDEELLFLYVEKFGTEKLKDVNGDFAGAIFDTEKNTCTLFRDHMGVRPLYYYENGELLAFSTDIRGLVSMDAVDVTVNESRLWHNLSGAACLSTEHTEFANIVCVKPGTFTVFSLKEMCITQDRRVYWQPGKKKVRRSSEKEYIQRMRELITDAVKRRLDAVSGPVGAEMSGGLDSGVIDILLHRMGRETFYFSWSASPAEIPFAENDERLPIEDICKQEKVVCHYRGKGMRFEEDCVLHQKMRAIGTEPNMAAGPFRRYVFPPHINTLQITQTAQYVHENGAKVIFTGHGGDEGVSHRCNPYEMFYHKEYFRYFKYMWDSTSGLKHRLYKTVMRSRKNLTVTRKELRNPFVGEYAVSGILNPEFAEKHKAEKGSACTYAYDPCTYVRDGGSRNRLDVVALLGAYCGARYLIPYLDYRVIDYALSIPRHLYLRANKNRYIFREAFRDIMPDSLYRLTGKADTSWASVEKKEPDEQENKEYMERKKRLFSMLDKERWEDYLDWEALEGWVNASRSKEEETRDMAYFFGIDYCLGFQNLVTFSKAVKEEK